MIRFFLFLLAATAARPLVAAEPERSFHLPSLYHVGFWVRDIAKSRAFYHDLLGYEEPYVLNRPTGELQMVIMKLNERQVIYLFPDATKILPNGDNLDHLGLETDNIEAAREHLLAQGVKVDTVHRGRIGDLLLGVRDPDGHYFEITQLEAEGQLRQHQGQSLPATRVSARLRSATLMVADLPAALHFYVEVLGFKRIEADDRKLTVGGIVRLQVPEGTDYLDLIRYEHKSGTELARGVPYYCLEIEDAAKTVELLSSRAKALGLPPPATISMSADGQRQTSCVDPDGTRVVFREEAKPR